MMRQRHQKKDIEDAIQYAEQQGWRIEAGGGHAWGKMYCPENDATCRCGDYCITSINSTPRNPVNHARQIRCVVDNCKHRNKDE